MNESSSTDPAEYWNSLLAWLDPDPDNAARKFETIRMQLTKMFAWEQCPDAEELADETIARIVKRVSEIRDSYTGDPRRFFYAVARKVMLEHRRKAQLGIAEVAAAKPDEVESRDQLYYCFDRCLRALPPVNRELLLAYFEGSTGGKLHAREDLAAQMGVSVNTLRLRVHRARASLAECVEQCKNEKNKIE